MDVPSPFADPDQSPPPPPQPGSSLRMSIFEQSRIVPPSISTHLGGDVHPETNRASSSPVEEEQEDDEDPNDLLEQEQEALIASSSRRSASSSSATSGKKRSSWRRSPRAPHQSRAAAIGGLDAKQKALWMWANVDNLDAFLQEVYAYYVGKGVICIALSRSLNLLTIAFVIGFSTFLFGCIDYSAIRHDGKLGDVIVGHCVAGFSPRTTFVVLVLAAMLGWQVVQFALGLSRLTAMNRFYTHLLNIPDADVQSIPWNEVVNRIATLREQHPTTSLRSVDEIESVSHTTRQQKLDAHDVANRLMRQENYLIALFNENILDLSVPGMRHGNPTLTKTLEWNLNFCLLGFLFDAQGQVRHEFLSERYRADLIEGLKRRFLFMAVVNAVFALFIVPYLLIYSFFRYFEEYHNDPSNLGSRQYTQYARWKFREFNELPHTFRRRCHSSYAPASKYIDQFPKEKTAIVARFVAFVAGSFMAVLILASVIDPDLFLHFDITPQRNVLFYIGVFGAILAVARGMIPNEHLVFEPETVLREVIHHTHYLPHDWKGRFHSAEVHQAFGQLYTLKIYIFFHELLSVITTPFVLWLSLPNCAPDLIDFFRKYTMHVDGLGHVCWFAVFDFARQTSPRAQPSGKVDATNRFKSAGLRQGKMEQSILGFRANHPDWDPMQAQSRASSKQPSASTTQDDTFTRTPTASGGAKVRDLLQHIGGGTGTASSSAARPW